MALAAELRKLLPVSLFSKTPRCSHLASLYTTRLGPRPTPGRFSYSMAGWVHHAREEPIPDEKSSHYNKRRPAAADTDNFNSREPQPPRTTMEDTDDHHFQARGKRWDRPLICLSRPFEAPGVLGDRQQQPSSIAIVLTSHQDSESF